MIEIDPIENERRMTWIETTLKDVVDNHLPHLVKKVDKLFWLLVTVLVTVVGLLLKSIL